MEKIRRWNCFFIKLTSINKVFETLNSYHKNIKFKIEIEKENKILFLGVLLIRNKNSINAKVTRKNINTNIYINWKPFTPNNWKWETLKILTTKSCSTCSTDAYLKEQLQHIRTVLHHRNNYPLLVARKNLSTDQSKPSSNDKIHRLKLPYQGDKIFQCIEKICW